MVWPFLLLALVAAVAVPAAASRSAEIIVLPGATSAEGIAAGRGATFYAGDLFAGRAASLTTHITYRILH